MQTVARPRPSKDFKIGDSKIEILAEEVLSSSDFNLYPIKLKNLETSSHLQIFLNYQDDIDQLAQPIYLAEILNEQAEFTHYLMLIGVDTIDQVQTLLEQLVSTQKQQINSIRSVAWQDIYKHLDTIEHLLDCYQQNDLIWQSDTYLAYLATTQFSSRKYMLFEEAKATTQTPLLLLEERHKLRLIHGDNRLKLNTQELLYPCIILKKDQHLTWQHIQSRISSMPKPVSAHDLYQALQSYIKN
ncbi:hypothetical protein [Acinetobacter sp. NCu2D-2]|uniref:hypothetical protein n=1 Tax=Acinetobacter sp. NCu2D-2 TaxID=1608473 RepID=UPI0009D6A363|nr:hypothetical protein [Acinetobacter sp. NCu2D-2]